MVVFFLDLTESLPEFSFEFCVKKISFREFGKRTDAQRHAVKGTVDWAERKVFATRHIFRVPLFQVLFHDFIGLADYIPLQRVARGNCRAIDANVLDQQRIFYPKPGGVIAGKCIEGSEHPPRSDIGVGPSPKIVGQ